MTGKKFYRRKLPLRRPAQAAVEVSSRSLRCPVGAVMKCLPLMTRATFRSITVSKHPLSTPQKVSDLDPNLQWF